jgi:hypothetical protein
MYKKYKNLITLEFLVPPIYDKYRKLNTKMYNLSLKFSIFIMDQREYLFLKFAFWASSFLAFKS